MNREEKFVITISRQFGTGGHEIGAELARRLGVKLLDKQILNEVAKRNRVVEEAMEKIETRNPLWRDDFTNFYQNYMSKAEYDGAEHDQTSHELFDAQAEAIRNIASRESCVIVGRCGFHIFADHPNALKIFIHSTEDCRKRRIAEKYGLDLRMQQPWWLTTTTAENSIRRLSRVRTGRMPVIMTSRSMSVSSALTALWIS